MDHDLKQLGEKTLEELKLAAISDKKNLVSVPQERSVLEAFKLLHEKHLTSIAVLDVRGNIVANLSMTDIKYLLKLDMLDLLHSSCKQAIQQIRLEKDRENEYKSVIPVFTVTKDSSLKRAIGKLLATKAHRLWVTADAVDHRPIGVLSLSDVLHLLTPSESVHNWAKHPLIQFVPQV